MNLDEPKKAISCVATGARHAPEFEWTLIDGDKILNIQTEEPLDKGKGTYRSTLNYTVQPRDLGKMLKCKAGIHQVQVKLNLIFKPAEFLYKKSQKVVTFRANPKPTSGIWLIGSTGRIDLTSSSFKDGDKEGEYEVEYFLEYELTPNFNDMKKEQVGEETIILSVTNSLGTTNVTPFKGGVISEDDDRSTTTKKPDPSSSLPTNLPKSKDVIKEEEVTTNQNWLPWVLFVIAIIIITTMVCTVVCIKVRTPSFPRFWKNHL